MNTYTILDHGFATQHRFTEMVKVYNLELTVTEIAKYMQRSSITTQLPITPTCRLLVPVDTVCTTKRQPPSLQTRPSSESHKRSEFSRALSLQHAVLAQRRKYLLLEPLGGNPRR